MSCHMNIVLLEPEIPMNTGNIGRTCVAAGASLHLIKPLGFETDDKSIRRSGLDYWQALDVHYHESFERFLERTSAAQNLYMATTKAKTLYTDVNFEENSFILFGKESAGIPEEILVEYEQACIRIPMREGYRSLNLANAAAIVLYEAMRQYHFNGMALQGQLHRMHWPGF